LHDNILIDFIVFKMEKVDIQVSWQEHFPAHYNDYNVKFSIILQCDHNLMCGQKFFSYCVQKKGAERKYFLLILIVCILFLWVNENTFKQRNT